MTSELKLASIGGPLNLIFSYLEKRTSEILLLFIIIPMSVSARKITIPNTFENNNFLSIQTSY